MTPLFQTCTCGSSRVSTWATVKKVRIVECADCGVRYVHAIDRDAYTKLYESGRYHAAGSDDLPHDKKSQDSHRLPHVERFSEDTKVAILRLAKLVKYKTSGKLIDVGCSNGAFMVAAESAGFESCGVDLSDEAVPENLKHRVVCGELNRAGFQRREADVITFNDSFEHFIDPVSALRAARGILKRTGILVIEIPDMESADALRDGPEFKHVKPNEHLWYFTATQLRALLEKNGFFVVGMDAPIPGKVTAYATVSSEVEEVEVWGPPGIGDIIWTMPHLKGIKHREWPCHLKYVVCCEGDRKLATRSKDFLLLSSLIDSVDFRPLPLPRDVGCEDPSMPVYELIANDYLDPKVKPYNAGFIEHWHPELGLPDYDTGIRIPLSAQLQVKLRLGVTVGDLIPKYAAIYMSSHVWNRITTIPVWTPKDWASLIIKLADNGLKPVILGAGWDADYAGDVAQEIVQLGREPQKVWLNMIGRTPIALAMAFMGMAEVTIGIAAGLPIIAAYSGWTSVILWPTRGISPVEAQFCPEFSYNWVPPHVLLSSSYMHLNVGEFDVDSLYSKVMGHIKHAGTYAKNQN